jgi:hypothetical protein
MTAGREMVRTGRLLRVDIFSYTVFGEPYPAYAVYWFMEIAFYAIYTLGGPALIVFVHGLLITSTYLLILILAWRVSGSWRVAALSTLFAAALGLNDWNVRPQAITFPIAALFLFAIHTYRERTRSGLLALFPLGMVLWVNSHGTFPLGLIIIGAWLAQEAWILLRERLQRSGGQTLTRLRAPVVALATSTLACLLNPRGLGILDYLSGMAESTMVQNFVPEWAPPTFDTLGGQLFYGGLLLSIAVLALSRRRPTLFQLGTFLAFAALGLKTSRGLIWFGIMAAPTLAYHLPDLGQQIRALLPSPKSDEDEETAAWLNYAFAALILVAVIATLPWFKPYLPLPDLKAGLVSQETPVEATRFLLGERPPTPLFHSVSFGSYLSWEAHPAYPVFIDPRIELYPLEGWADYIQISTAAPGWEEQLEAYDVRTLLVSPQEQPGLMKAAQTSPTWEQIYEDDVTVVFTRP